MHEMTLLLFLAALTWAQTTFDTCCICNLHATNIAKINERDQNTNMRIAKWYFRVNLFIRVENCISARLIDEVCAESYWPTFVLHPTNRNSSISFLASLELRHRRNIFNARIIYIFIEASRNQDVSGVHAIGSSSGVSYTAECIRAKWFQLETRQDSDVAITFHFVCFWQAKCLHLSLASSCRYFLNE